MQTSNITPRVYDLMPILRLKFTSFEDIMRKDEKKKWKIPPQCQILNAMNIGVGCINQEATTRNCSQTKSASSNRSYLVKYALAI